jgi:tetratricopeptide (TPR) repeat protein
MNVLPLVNKSLALFQWKKDGVSAEQFCLEALQSDPLCEAAFATLGQIYLAQQDFDKALARFRDLTKISSNAPQLALTFYHIYVSTPATLASKYLADILHSPPKPKSNSCTTIRLMPRASHENSQWPS